MPMSSCNKPGTTHVLAAFSLSPTVNVADLMAPQLDSLSTVGSAWPGLAQLQASRAFGLHCRLPQQAQGTCIKTCIGMESKPAE